MPPDARTDLLPHQRPARGAVQLPALRAHNNKRHQERRSAELNQQRAESLLRGQSSLARKIFHVVPALAYWSANQIKGAMEAGGASSADVRAIWACLADLEDAGLVYQQGGMFRRCAIGPGKPAQNQNQTQNQTQNQNQQKEAAPMTQAQTKPQAEKLNSLDKLAELSGELAEIAGQLQLRLVRVTKIARELEDVALAVEQERESGAKKSEKLNQLQKLLADLAKG